MAARHLTRLTNSPRSTGSFSESATSCHLCADFSQIDSYARALILPDLWTLSPGETYVLSAGDQSGSHDGPSGCKWPAIYISARRCWKSHGADSNIFTVLQVGHSDGASSRDAGASSSSSNKTPSNVASSNTSTSPIESTIILGETLKSTRNGDSHISFDATVLLEGAGDLHDWTMKYSSRLTPSGSQTCQQSNVFNRIN